MMIQVHRIALTALLGSALVACAVSQQDNQPPSAAGKTPAAPTAPSAPTAQTAPRHATPDAGDAGALKFAMRPALRVEPVPSMQVVPRHGPLPRMRRADGPLLGVKVAETPDGLQVDSVEDGSLAQSAGVKEKDIVLRIGDAHVHDIADIQRALRALKPGDSVTVGVIRAGEGIVELKGTLPEPKAAPTPPTPPAPPAADGFKGGFLGVQMARPEDDKDAAGTGGPGVKVAGVVPDSSAWFAGLQEGDRLLALDGKTLGSGEDLVGAVSGKEPGSLVELRYTRDGAEHTVQVRLGRREPASPLGGLQFFNGAPGAPGEPGLRGMPGMQGLQAMPGLRLRFGDHDVEPFAQGQDDDNDVFRFMQDPQQFFGGAFKGFNIDNPGPGSQSVQIEMRDGQGTMTVTRDGKTQHYTLDGNGNWVQQDGQDGQDGAAPDGTTPDQTSTDTDTQAPRVRNG